MAKQRTPIADGTDVGMMKVTFHDHFPGELGKEVAKLADGLGVRIDQLEGVLIVIPKPNGDALAEVVAHRIWGRNAPKTLT
jgi:hypothetical protein